MDRNDFEILATGLGFPEGPVAYSDGSVVFCELAARCLTWLHPDGSVSRVDVGGSPNGLAVGPDGALYICNNGGADYRPGHFLPVGPGKDYAGGFIQRYDPQSKDLRTLYTHCNDQRLSAPNDLVFDEHGGFYFTDSGKRLPRQREHGGLYYALADGSKVVELSYPILTPNGVGLSPDEKVLYVADTETSRLWAFDIIEPGRINKLPFPSPYGGRLICGLPGFQKFDSLAVETGGNICVATLNTGFITVFTPAGEIARQVRTPDDFPTNICFGGTDLKMAYVTLARSGELARVEWAEAGLKLNFSK